MGVDLRLLPVQNAHTGNWYSHSILDLTRDYDLWERIRKVPSLPLPEPLSCFCAIMADGVQGYDRKEKDAYGDPLRMVWAKDLAIAFHTENLSTWNHAVHEFIEALPPDTWIVLDWD